MTRISLLGHSGVRLQKRGAQLVIDPGVYSQLSGLGEAAAVLVTHGHPDHLAPGALDRFTADVWAPEDVVTQLVDAGVPPQRLHAVAPGESFQVAGFEVMTLGGEHAVIHSTLPTVRNNAYLIDEALMLPGDSFTLSQHPGVVEVLFTPMSAPWLKLAESIDYVQRFPNAIIVPIHDAILSDAGKRLVDSVLGRALPARTLRRLQPGESLDI